MALPGHFVEFFACTKYYYYYYHHTVTTTTTTSAIVVVVVLCVAVLWHIYAEVFTVATVPSVSTPVVVMWLFCYLCCSTTTRSRWSTQYPGSCQSAETDIILLQLRLLSLCCTVPWRQCLQVSGSSLFAAC